MSWWKSIISQWETLPFPHSSLRSEHKQPQHSCQKSGTSQASLPLLRLKFGPCFYSPEPPIRKLALLSPFPGKSHLFHQRGVLRTLKADTLWLWSHLSPQTNENQTWSELDLKATGKSDGCLRLIPWTVPFLVCNGDFRRDYSQKSTSSVSLPLSPYGICSLLYQNLWQNAVVGIYLGWVKMWIIYAHCIESLEGGPDNLEVGKTPWVILM